MMLRSASLSAVCERRSLPSKQESHVQGAMMFHKTLQLRLTAMEAIESVSPPTLAARISASSGSNRMKQ